jgi:hypothetical protein
VIPSPKVSPSKNQEESNGKDTTGVPVSKPTADLDSKSDKKEQNGPFQTTPRKVESVETERQNTTEVDQTFSEKTKSNSSQIKKIIPKPLQEYKEETLDEVNDTTQDNKDQGKSMG